MSDRALSRLLIIGAAATVAAAVLTSLTGASGPALGILVGGLWNLLSLWCLIHLLNAWVVPPPVLGLREAGRKPPLPLGPRLRRGTQVGGWLLVKFPLLYALLFVSFRHQAVSLLGFGVGFTVVLVVALGVLGFSARQMIGAPRGR